MQARRRTRRIMVGSLAIGGGAPLSVQTMTKTNPCDVEATVAQINEIAALGGELVRLAVPNRQAAEALAEIKRLTRLPLVADIHFDYKLALAALEAGVDGLRINPGNIGGAEKVHRVAEAAQAKGVPIRIGVNIGSLAPEIADKYGRSAKGLVESALSHVTLLEKEHFQEIAISVKASDVPMMIDAYRLLSERVDYPLHLGVTEAGGPWAGTIKSAIGIGTLLSEGIGDTIRVSLTGSPSEEVRVGRQILVSLGLRRGGIDLISCPTCGRTKIDLISLAREVERRLPATDQVLKVAVMGCVVNGPGEAKEADVGIAGGNRCGFLFKKGERICKLPEDQLVERLLEEINHLLDERKETRCELPKP